MPTDSHPTAAEIRPMLDLDRPLFPEAARLATVRLDAEAIAAPEALVAEPIPPLTFTQARAFARRGDREPYETPYFRRREILDAAVLLHLAGHGDYLDTIHDAIWAICDEPTWVIPAHARLIDLMAASTALALAEILSLLGDALDWQVRHRLRREVDNRVLAPFLACHYDLRWWEGADNWNGVCSGAVGSAFLYLERDLDRLADALALVLRSLDAYLGTAFEPDGGTTEGVGYWHYGLQNVVIFAELLRERTGGGLDLLADPRLRRIAAFPAAMQLPSGRFVPFSDCPEVVEFHPGIVARLAGRTGEPALLGLLELDTARSGQIGGPPGLRNLLWWDGQPGSTSTHGDMLLPETGIARLTATASDGSPIGLIAKAGHNGENHNHNDIGSFVLDIDGEEFLTDPGPGHRDRDYFDARTRYQNPFANASTHSVSLIDDQLQGTGETFRGTIATDGRTLTLDLTAAYANQALSKLTRRLTLPAQGDTLWLEDTFVFTEPGHTATGQLVTWLPVSSDGPTAVIHGARHRLRLTIEQPESAAFTHDILTAESAANRKPVPLQRLRIPLGDAPTLRLRLDILPPS